MEPHRVGGGERTTVGGGAGDAHQLLHDKQAPIQPHDFVWPPAPEESSLYEGAGRHLG